MDGLKLRCNTKCFSDTSEATKDSKAKPGVPQCSPRMPPPGRWPGHSARSPSTGATTAAWPESSVPAGLRSQSSKPIASSLGSQKPPGLLLRRFASQTPAHSPCSREQHHGSCRCPSAQCCGFTQPINCCQSHLPTDSFGWLAIRRT